MSNDKANDLFVQILLNGHIIDPKVGKNDFEGEDLRISYDLGQSGKKEIFFEEDKLIIKVNHTGKFVETIPILKSAWDELNWNDHQIVLKNSESSMVIDFKNSSGIEEFKVEGDFHTKECHSFKISAEESLEYQIYLK